MKWFFAPVLILIFTGCGGIEGFPPPGPSITAVSPNHSLAGTIVTISGTNFSSTPSENIVMFNGTTAVVSTSSTSSQIVTMVPTGATTGPITVKVGSKTATSSINFVVTEQIGGAVQGNALSLAAIVSTTATNMSIIANSPNNYITAPYGITTDGTNLFVTDVANNVIYQIVIATRTITILAGTYGTSGSMDGTGAAASFSSPFGITTDGTNLYVADAGNNTIRKIVIATGVVTTLAGTAGNSGSADGTGPAASFTNPIDVSTDDTNLYVADTGNNTIRKIVIATGAVTTLAGTAGNSGSTDGTGPAAAFTAPFGVTTDGTNLYVTDNGNNTVRKIVLASGTVTTLAGTADILGATDGIGAAASFNAPEGITTDGTNLYVSDSGNSTIRKIVIATKSVTTLAGTGATASFTSPAGITTDGTNLYVADTGNGSIMEIQ